ncbi:MAG TPA: hypothetical protein VFV49_16360 [Thermoanaerobaculia bacterium]|nr:hypothetical protein [Thermoanaerobaculia bacterium]
MFASALLGLVVAATAGVLPPRVVVPLPKAIGEYVTDVSWESAEGLLVATGEGVHRYSIRDRTVQRILPGTALPDGLRNPMAIASDGTTVVATSDVSMGAYAMRRGDRKRVFAQRG